MMDMAYQIMWATKVPVIYDQVVGDFYFKK